MAVTDGTIVCIYQVELSGLLSRAEERKSLQPTEGTRKNSSFPNGGHSFLPVSPSTQHILLASARTEHRKLDRSFPNVRNSFSEF